MTLKEIAAQILTHDETFACKIQNKKTQILVKCNDWPDETVVLLSPYYQQRIADGLFDQNDMDAVLIEVDRIRRFGM